jgi:ABC-type transport system involved in multi-copper enzyme maturation permease subunit
VAFLLTVFQDPGWLLILGRVYGAILHAQLIADLFVVVFVVLLAVWPRGAAVALAAFREGLRQPMFWLLFALALGIMVASPFIPYFTFGEDFKMVKEIGYDLIMLASVAFAVLAASMSISEEIEGRTAITLMSKPVSRRQFLLGKFAGILLAALVMTSTLGWAFDWILWFKPVWDGEPPPEPAWLEATRQSWTLFGETAINFALGAALWFADALAATPGLVFGFCQAMVLLAIAVALATRLPMVVNLVICLVVFFLGHLTQVLVQVSQGRFALVNFMARVFDTLLPGLDFFDLGPVIARDVPLEPQAFAMYTGSVVLYAVLYTIIALLFGLILFEDRDLA